jgi:hypothetical protein
MPNATSRHSIINITLMHQLQQLNYDEYIAYLAHIHKRDHRIPRIALVNPMNAPWEHLYDSGNHQAFITMLGFDKLTFDGIVEKFTPYFNNLKPHETTFCMKTLSRGIIGGAPCKIQAHTCVALCLAYFRFKGPLSILQGWFGISNLSISVWLRFTFIILINILRNDLVCTIEFPDDDTITYYKQCVTKKYRYLSGVYCVCDGLKLEMEKPKNQRQQTRFYWIQKVVVIHGLERKKKE